MASPPRHDAWPPYKPHQQRVVFIRQPGRLQPLLGYVVTWPVSGTGNRYCVAWWDDGPTPGLRITWMRRSEIEPIGVDPNWLDDRRRR